MQISLEQWQAMLAVVDSGGYAKAAEKLGKSQSAISYSVQKLESGLNVRVFRLDGRRAVLTEAGEALCHHARRLIEQAEQAEQLAEQFGMGYEAQIHIAMDTIFPKDLMLETLATYAQTHPQTRISLLETVLSGSDEAVLKRHVDMAISGRVPPGVLGEHLLKIPFVVCAHPSHPLHQIERPLTLNDLRQHRQLVVRDSGSRSENSGWLGADQRWTLSSVSTSVHAACKGIGYAWYPLTHVSDALKTGLLKPLALETGAIRYADLYLILTDGELARPGVKKLAYLIKDAVNGDDINDALKW